MKLLGKLLPMSPAATVAPQKQQHRHRRSANQHVAPGNVFASDFFEAAVEPVEESAQEPFGFLRGRRNMADNAGESVNALKAEISTEMAMVTANCWFSSPECRP